MVVPEVVHLEVEANLRTQLTSAVDSVQTNHRKLLAVFGRLKEVVLPTQSEIERVVSEVFAIDQIESPRFLRRLFGLSQPTTSVP